MPDPDPPRLDYESKTRQWRQQRVQKRTRRVLIGLGILFIVGILLFKFGRTEWAIWQAFRYNRSIEQNVLNYHPQPTQIVVDDDPADFGKLLASDPQYRRGWNHQVIYWPPASVSSLPMSNLEVGTPILYIGFRQTRAGTRDQVICYADGTNFGAATITPARFGHPPVWRHEMQSDFVVLRTVQQHLKIYAGQSDPADASHFTIAYSLGNTPGLIDGWLQDDETVKLQLRDEPTKLP